MQLCDIFWIGFSAIICGRKQGKLGSGTLQLAVLLLLGGSEAAFVEGALAGRVAPLGLAPHNCWLLLLPALRPHRAAVGFRSLQGDDFRLPSEHSGMLHKAGTVLRLAARSTGRPRQRFQYLASADGIPYRS